MTIRRHDSASTNHDGAVSARWTAVRADLQARRSQRAGRKVLERELADYQSASDQAELDAILSRYETTDVRDIRQMVLRTRVAA